MASKNNSNNTVIVQLNVGGTKYEVSRSLLESYPETMLASLISERWQEDPEKEIFIDRNGVRFQYVLDYMRDGIVHIPVAVSKLSVLNDLSYFGFENVPTSAIDSSCAGYEAAAHVAMHHKNYKERKEELIAQFFFEFLAFQCFKEFSGTGKRYLCVRAHSTATTPNHEYGKIAKPSNRCSDYSKLFNKCLAEYGLKGSARELDSSIEDGVSLNFQLLEPKTK